MARPREFDAEEALDGALKQFWLSGYEGTSMKDLELAMGVTRPSIYSAFGCKEELFQKVLDRYEERHLGFVEGAMALPTAYEVAEALLIGFVEANTERMMPQGCLGTNGAIACSSENEPIRLSLIKRRNDKERVLRERFVRAKRDGDLPADADPRLLAKYVMTVSAGVALQAKAGASRSALKEVLSLALKSFPQPVKNARTAASSDRATSVPA